VKKAALAFLPDKRRKRARQMAMSPEKFEAQLLGMLDRIEKRWAAVEPLKWPDGPQWVDHRTPQTGSLADPFAYSVMQITADAQASRKLVTLDFKTPSAWVEVDHLPPLK